MKTMLSMLALACAVSGCASSSMKIAPSYVSTYGYEGMSCARLREEAQIVSQRAAVASGAQDQQSKNDAVAVGVAAVVFWPALFFIGGDKAEAAELARLKGEMQAIEQVNSRKNCGIIFRQ